MTSCLIRSSSFVQTRQFCRIATSRVERETRPAPLPQSRTRYSHFHGRLFHLLDDSHDLPLRFALRALKLLRWWDVWPAASSVSPGPGSQLIICRAPSFPRTPGSVGFGLRSRPFFLRKENMPLFDPDFNFALFESDMVALWSARFVQLPVSSRTICTPPPLLIFLVAPRGLGGGGWYGV